MVILCSSYAQAVNGSAGPNRDAARTLTCALYGASDSQVASLFSFGLVEDREKPFTRFGLCNVLHPAHVRRASHARQNHWQFGEESLVAVQDLLSRGSQLLRASRQMSGVRQRERDESRPTSDRERNVLLPADHVGHRGADGPAG